MSRAHIALQELHAVALMLHRMAFHLSSKVVALHLDNITAKAYLCNQGGTVSPFLSRLACQILESDQQAQYYLFFQHTFLPTSMWRQIICPQHRLLPEWHLLPQVAQVAFHIWGLPEVDLLASSHSTQCQHYFTLATPLPVGALGLIAFSHPWTFQVSYVFPPLALVPLVLSSFLAEHVNGQLRHVILGGTMLDGGSLASHHSQHVGRCSLAVSHGKRSCCGCFGRPGTQGSVISAFNPLAAQHMCYANRGSLPWSVSGGWGNLNIYIKGLQAVLEGMGWLVCWTGFTK